MRDSAVIQAFQKMEGMVGHDIRTLNSAVSTLAIRHDAIQKLLFGGRFSLLWAVILNILAPKMLERSIGRLHAAMQSKYHEDMAKAVAEARKPKIVGAEDNTNPLDLARQEQAQEKIEAASKKRTHLASIVMPLLFLLVLPSCVTKRAHLKAVEEAVDKGYNKASTECYRIQMQLLPYVTRLQERLRDLNQLNPDNSLRYKGQPPVEAPSPANSPLPSPSPKAVKP